MKSLVRGSKGNLSYCWGPFRSITPNLIILETGGTEYLFYR